MNLYHAIVSTDDPEGIHKRVSIEAEYLDRAKDLFAARYAKERIVSVWGDYEAAKRRVYTI
jgi:hypothetical protein